MRVGISVLTHAGQSIWENGLGQNVLYLASLLRSLPFVTSVVLLNSGDQASMPPEVALDGLDIRLVAPRDATDLIDVAIELAGGLDVEWLDYLRALGKKVVFHACGQPYVGLIEPQVFGKAGYFSKAQRCDEVWILQRDLPFAPMLEAIHRCPVFDVPYLWSPEFLQRRADELEMMGVRFGYTAQTSTEQQRAMRALVFEPNISVTKACSIPMLICDAAFRRDRGSVSDLRLLNSVQMKDHLTFQHLTGSLELAKEGKVQFDQRHDLAGYMAQYGDLVITHQWQQDQNTVYLDTLYGGYPLIHNSDWLQGTGYFYRDFDIDGGALALITASKSHDANLSSYRSRARSFLDTLSPYAAANCDRYARRLLHLCAKKPDRSAA